MGINFIKLTEGRLPGQWLHSNHGGGVGYFYFFRVTGHYIPEFFKLAFCVRLDIIIRGVQRLPVFKLLDGKTSGAVYYFTYILKLPPVYYTGDNRCPELIIFSRV